MAKKKIEVIEVIDATEPGTSVEPFDDMMKRIRPHMSTLARYLQGTVDQVRKLDDFKDMSSKDWVMVVSSTFGEIYENLIELLSMAVVELPPPDDDDGGN